MKMPLIAAAFALLAAAPAQDRLVPADARYLTAEGKVRVVGYNDMDEMLVPLARAFEARHPGIRFELILKGTRTAPRPLTDGTSAFAPMGAAFEPGDLIAWRRVHRHDPLPVPIAHDSLTPGALSSPTGIFVHESSPLRTVSVDTLRRVFAPRSGERRIRLWRELGVKGARGDRPIRLVGLASDTAIGSLMLRRLGGPAYAGDFTALRQSRDVAAAVIADPDALGIANLNHARAGIRPLAIFDRSGRIVAGDAQGIRSGRYPFDRHLLIYVRRDSGGRVEPLAREFLALALSPEGQRIIASGRRGYLPLNPSELAKARKSIGLRN